MRNKIKEQLLSYLGNKINNSEKKELIENINYFYSYIESKKVNCNE